MKTWLITGCSSGLGRSLAEGILRRGHNVVVTARNPDTLKDLVAGYPDTALAVALDVTNAEQVAHAVKVAEDFFGGLDVLVNNAGYGYRAAVEEGEESEVSALFATNVFGAIAMMKAVLPFMRARRTGTIINVSSIAAQWPPQGSGYYAASKLALEGISQSLRREVEPLGIRVMIVEPGAFRTDFTGRSLQQSAAAIADYAETAGKRRKENDKTHGAQPGDPERAAEALFSVVEGDEIPVRLLLGSDAVRIVGTEVQRHLEEIESWKAISEKTDFAAED